MRVTYDPKYDVLYLKFSEEKIADTVEVVDGVLIDYGEDGEMIGIEVIETSRLIKTNPLQEIDIKIRDGAKV